MEPRLAFPAKLTLRRPRRLRPVFPHRPTQPCQLRRVPVPAPHLPPARRPNQLLRRLRLLQAAAALLLPPQRAKVVIVGPKAAPLLRPTVEPLQEMRPTAQKPAARKLVKVMRNAAMRAKPVPSMPRLLRPLPTRASQAARRVRLAARARSPLPKRILRLKQVQLRKPTIILQNRRSRSAPAVLALRDLPASRCDLDSICVCREILDACQP